MIRQHRRVLHLSFILLLGLSAVGYADQQEKTALVIIDLQSSFITRGGHDKDPENVTKVNQLFERELAAISAARKANIPIVVEQYDGEGPTDPRILKALDGYKNKKVFNRLINRILLRRAAVRNSRQVSVMTKNQDGMLDDENSSKAELLSYLQANHIGNLIITGANGGACVSESISGALNNKFNVVAVSSEIADFNYEKFIYPYEASQYADFQQRCHGECSFKVIPDINGLNFNHPFIEKQTSGSGDASGNPSANPGD